LSSASIEFTAQELMAHARASTGINFIDSEIEEPLTELLKALNAEAKLSEAGAKGITSRISRVLNNRLRMQRDFQAHPEINQILIKQPVFITSPPRTGSTKLHKLLSMSSDFRYLRCWQGQSLALRTGNRDEDIAPRIADSEAENAFFNTQSPQAKLVHEYSTFEPEEDVLIYEHFLYAHYICSFAFVPSYVQWYAQQRDVEKELAFLRQTLKYLQWQFYQEQAERWVLKAPHYNGSEDLVLKLFPDAKFVITHRDPVKSASSLPSLFASFLKAYSDADWNEVVGPMALAGLGNLAQLHLSVRESRADIPFLDISYSKLTTDIEPVIHSLYEYLDMPLKQASLQRMLDWNELNKQHKLGVHKHTLEEYSLDQETVENNLADYINRFRAYF